ncbi:MAG: uroporphyrinogen-III C-methyltransferase [Cenarchaeum sp. SB0665_bin_23]|nr:uroporphyrinogen-III C-methyltransferase [Cenarchaeum sp. SB0667_bin_13]MXY37871.1 uroporphyrinogen-III C-methyltransferase [Cenarchaeum sp. SB0664_bin_35]MXY61586.1 uroporphyrinogen-III C-methyltransferase [Cenarchaeum sp. SB0665_bin_23]MXZ93618.1 uroporphyrinogen-III C-methyltransferase [Cenarchaeum sp. SB0666_bin_15]MYB46538.1 uroporphyrinogen-III C-methyltransferase [Cenarchaeum sp. SB0662_bin_33]MYC79731.1 uroporphyrinogen-III C-methyltransferase [Cenarchaeum sp. SB0661_bin_35]MYD5898
MTVYLVGAGPGDPGLLTMRAAELLQKADVVLYDRLVDESIIAMIPNTTKKVYVGRAVGDDASHQNSTNQYMLEYAEIMKTVVRLKGGDPIIFGRGGEEAQFLKKHNIKYEIVPGITSGIGSATYSGIPLTFRGYSSSVVFVTGHEDPLKETESVRWQNLAKSVDTIVIMMGLSRIRTICDELMRGGMDPAIPVSVIQNGTTSRQEIVTGPISDIARIVKESDMSPPANIIIGRVVDLHQELRWR